MTPTQRRVYDAICRYWQREGHGPSLDDLKPATGVVSKSAVKDVVDRLVRDGYVSRRPGSARSLRPTVAPAANAVASAAQRLLDNIVRDDPDKGVAIVRSRDLGDLDIALAELTGMRREPRRALP
ncbi:MAG: LexA family protein [Kiloniellaceae bacterium]